MHGLADALRVPTPLSEMIKRGGVYFNVGGTTPTQVLTEAIESIELPRGVTRDLLLNAILERESLMPTAIGNGIAIPHPRSPLMTDSSQQRVAVMFLKTPIAYNALDKQPVSVLFIILSSDARSHLAVLAALTHLCRRPDFKTILSERPSTEELSEFIRRIEAGWAQSS